MAPTSHGRSVDVHADFFTLNDRVMASVALIKGSGHNQNDAS